MNLRSLLVIGTVAKCLAGAPRGMQLVIGRHLKLTDKTDIAGGGADMHLDRSRRCHPIIGGDIPVGEAPAWERNLEAGGLPGPAHRDARANLCRQVARNALHRPPDPVACRTAATGEPDHRATQHAPPPHRDQLNADLLAFISH